MRKALVVGINEYPDLGSLNSCVSDALAVEAVLARHYDGEPNFAVRRMTASGPGEVFRRADLKKAVAELFCNNHAEVALFYFAGHGHLESTGGYLCCSDAATGDDGYALADLMETARRCNATHKIILLDSCYSGHVGADPAMPDSSKLWERMSILTASSRTDEAREARGTGVFTNLLVDGLAGAAANVLGNVTPGALYAHIDQGLGYWMQRPVFKTNVQSFVSLRRTRPPVERSDLRRITGFFPSENFVFPLDPGYEPESGAPVPDKVAVFKILQQYNRVNLLVPVDAPHMYHAAMERKACRLTALGEHYRKLTLRGDII